MCEEGAAHAHVTSRLAPHQRRELGGDDESARYISPHCVIDMGSLGLLFAPTVTFSIFRTVSIPSMTLPKTTCLPSSQSHASQVMKN